MQWMQRPNSHQQGYSNVHCVPEAICFLYFWLKWISIHGFKLQVIHYFSDHDHHRHGQLSNAFNEKYSPLHNMSCCTVPSTVVKVAKYVDVSPARIVFLCPCLRNLALCLDSLYLLSSKHCSFKATWQLKGQGNVWGSVKGQQALLQKWSSPAHLDNVRAALCCPTWPLCLNLTQLYWACVAL